MILRMLRCVCALFFGVVSATLARTAKADPCGAHAQDTIATDRPQVTNSSIVVPCGSLQFENGFLAATPNGGQRGFDFPETSVRFGIPGKTELRHDCPDGIGCTACPVLSLRAVNLVRRQRRVIWQAVQGKEGVVPFRAIPATVTASPWQCHHTLHVVAISGESTGRRGGGVGLSTAANGSLLS